MSIFRLPLWRKNFLLQVYFQLIVIIVFVLVCIPVLAVAAQQPSPDTSSVTPPADTPAVPPERVALQYGRALYARDFSTAYRLLSAADRRLKDQESYMREQGTFSGFTLEIAKRLASFIQVALVEKNITGDRAVVKLQVKLPNANAPVFQSLLLDWDEERLNALPLPEQQAIKQTLDQWHAEEKIPMIEGEEEFVLVKEAGEWRVFLDWAAGVRLLFDTRVPSSLPIEATPVQKEVVAPRGEVVQVYFRVKNRSNHPVSTRIAHHVAPQDMAEYLELVQCALLFPVQLEPGEEEEYFSAYLVRGDLSGQERQFEITYEFLPEDTK